MTPTESLTDWNSNQDQQDEGLRLKQDMPSCQAMDLTPMVDVTFLLLIFFMITASFTLQKTIPVPPPDEQEAGTGAVPKIEDYQYHSIIVSIDKHNNIFLDGSLVADPRELVEAFSDNVKRDMLITAHYDTFQETVVLVVDAGHEAGMQKIRLASVQGGSEY